MLREGKCCTLLYDRISVMDHLNVISTQKWTSSAPLLVQHRWVIWSYWRYYVGRRRPSLWLHSRCSHTSCSLLFPSHVKAYRSFEAFSAGKRMVCFLYGNWRIEDERASCLWRRKGLCFVETHRQCHRTLMMRFLETLELQLRTYIYILASCIMRSHSKPFRLHCCTAYKKPSAFKSSLSRSRIIENCISLLMHQCL